MKKIVSFIILAILLVIIAFASLNSNTDKEQERVNSTLAQSEPKAITTTEATTTMTPQSTSQPTTTPKVTVPPNISPTPEGASTTKVTSSSEATPTPKAAQTPPSTTSSKSEVATTPVAESKPTPKPDSKPTTKPEPTVTPEVDPEPAPQPQPEPTFDINHWIQYAKNYGTCIGMTLDSSATGSWDNPITASSSSQYLERDIQDLLNWYHSSYGYTHFWVWYDDLGNGKYQIYIGYA